MTLNLALKLAGCLFLLIGAYLPHAGRSAKPDNGSRAPAHREPPVTQAAE